jgi:hypothetical protein
MDLLNYQNTNDLSYYEGGKMTITMDSILLKPYYQEYVDESDGTRTYSNPKGNYPVTTAVVFIDSDGEVMKDVLVDPSNTSPSTSPNEGNWTSGEYYNGIILEPFLSVPESINLSVFDGKVEVNSSLTYEIDVPLGAKGYHWVIIENMGSAIDIDPSPNPNGILGSILLQNDYSNSEDLGLQQYDKLLFRQNLVENLNSNTLNITKIYSTKTYTGSSVAVVPGEEFYYYDYQGNYNRGYVDSTGGTPYGNVLGISSSTSFTETSPKDYTSTYNAEYGMVVEYIDTLVYVTQSTNDNIPIAVVVSDTLSGYTRGGYKVTLNAGFSSDADGDSLSYSWEVVSTSGPSVTLSNSTESTTSFVAPELQGGDTNNEMVFRVTVNDGKYTDSAEITIITMAPFDPNKNYCPSNCTFFQ